MFDKIRALTIHSNSIATFKAQCCAALCYMDSVVERHAREEIIE